MTQFLQARDISLDELHKQFGLQHTSEKSFFPEWQEAVYGLSVNGREFVFIKLTNADKINLNPTYARSYALSLERNGDLKQVLETLKGIRKKILDSKS